MTIRSSLVRALFIVLGLGSLLVPEGAKQVPAAAPAKPQAKDGAAAKAGAAPKAFERPTFECRWAMGPIVIDGRADEPAWSRAAVFDKFGPAWLGANADGTPKLAAASTKAKLLWDANGLYFFADMQDGDLFADLTEHDSKTWFNDVFELFFKPTAKHPGYYEFQVNAAGTQMDIFIPVREDGIFEKHIASDPFAWTTAVVRRGTLNQRGDRDQGWSVEGRIPWTDFVHTGGRPAVDESWLFALCRYDYDNKQAKPELSTIAPLTEVNYHQHERYANLKFVGPADGIGRPYGLDKRVEVTTSTVVGSPEPPLPYRVVRAHGGLRVDGPLIVRRQPDTKLLMVLQNEKGRTPSRLIRFADPAPGENPATWVAPDVDPKSQDPKDKDAKPAVDPRFEVLHTFNGTCYDLVFHPKFAENGYVYFGSGGPEKPEPGEKKYCRISRYTMETKPPYRFDPASEKVIVQWTSNGHNGHAVAFGNDGLFYFTSGDGTSDSDDDVVGQDMTTILAKVLRIDVDHVGPDDVKAGRAYSIPKDNPFVSLAGARPETWAYGLRNPWRMAVDPQTGYLWVTQNGQDLFEQNYFVRKGDNYGWSVTEGSAPFYMERKRGPTPIVLPTTEHSHAEARSLTGGVVYYGKRFPELVGHYIYGDYATGKIWAVLHDGTKVVSLREIADTDCNLTGFGLDSDGELLICDYRPEFGGLYRFERIPPPSKENPPKPFPRTLSASGLFVPGQGHKTVTGVIPYSVNSQLWSDGTYKERFIALPPGTEKISHQARRSWDFPEGTVLIKSFALEQTVGDPKSRRWIETRFFTKQQNEWIGYSYEWNDAQTDATLVGAKGSDRTFTIADSAAGAKDRQQTWHYPSRAECMVCHSRAANYVLGITSQQLNCEQDYGGTRDNQLRTLAHLGLIPTDQNAELHEGVVSAAELRGLSAKEAEASWLAIRREAAKQRPATAIKSEIGVGYEMLSKMVDPADKTAPIEMRARSYLHSNCAHCHVEAGGGNAQFTIAYWTATSDTRTLDVKPVHSTFNIPNAKLITPNHPETSMMFHRTAMRGRGQMPPIASSLIDPVGVEVLREWIATMPKPRPPQMVDPAE